MNIFFLIMAFIAAVIAYIAYYVARRPDRIKVYHENPPSMETSHAWGYRPSTWWRRYEGVPGMGKEKPHLPTVTPPTPGKYVPSFRVVSQ